MINKDCLYSADSSSIIFESLSSYTGITDNDKYRDVYHKKINNNVLTLISTDSKGLNFNNETDGSSISPDGNYLTFITQESLAGEDTNGTEDVYIVNYVMQFFSHITIKLNFTREM